MLSRISACGAGDAPTLIVTASAGTAEASAAASEDATVAEAAASTEAVASAVDGAGAGADEEAGAADPPQAARENAQVRASADTNSCLIDFICLRLLLIKRFLSYRKRPHSGDG